MIDYHTAATVGGYAGAAYGFFVAFREARRHTRTRGLDKRVLELELAQDEAKAEFGGISRRFAELDVFRRDIQRKVREIARRLDDSEDAHAGD